MALWTHSLKKKFILVFGGVSLLILAAVSVGYVGFTSSIEEFRRVTEQEVSQERTINAMVSGFKKQVQEWKNVLLRGADTGQRDKYWGKFEQQEASIIEQGRTLLAGMPDSEARRLVTDFLAAHVDMGVAYRRGLQEFVDSGFQPAAGDQAVKGIDRAPTELLEEAAAAIAGHVQASTEHALGYAEMTATFTLGGSLLVLVFGVGLSMVFVERRALHPLRDVEAALNQMAEGDFQVQIGVHGDDELGRLAASARRLRDNLGGLLQRMAGMAEELDQAGGYLAELGVNNRSQLDIQHQGTSQVATASEQLAATAKEVAGGAAGAADAAHTAERSTSAGRLVVEQAINAINQLEADVRQVSQVLAELESQSGAIGNVLNVIRGIAEQTNLLALNAAIEAARAGDQGRGFAVVADEVRSLAQRTQESTQEIQLTIEQLQQGSKAAVQAMQQGQGRVHEGVARTQEIGQALEAIAAAVATIVDINTQIATAAEQQGVVASDVSRNVGEIDHSSQELLGSAEALAQASTQIAGMSASLVEAVGRFRV